MYLYIAATTSGFTRQRWGRAACVTQSLLAVMDAWTEVIDGGGISTWTSEFMKPLKAFDSVPHRHLLAKLAAHGIQGRVLDCIQAFLSDRKQYVVVSGAKSQEAPVSSSSWRSRLHSQSRSCDE